MESNARITDFLFNKASGRKIPLNGTFELSPECNFACRMCYVRKTRREILAHDRPMLTLEQWLEIARQAREQGLLYLLLTGGRTLPLAGFLEAVRRADPHGFPRFHQHQRVAH